MQQKCRRCGATYVVPLRDRSDMCPKCVANEPIEGRMVLGGQRNENTEPKKRCILCGQIIPRGKKYSCSPTCAAIYAKLPPREKDRLWEARGMERPDQKHNCGRGKCDWCGKEFTKRSYNHRICSPECTRAERLAKYEEERLRRARGGNTNHAET